MIILAIMLFAVIVVYIISALRKRSTPEQDYFQETSLKYSAKEYFERIENEHTQILKECENQEPYTIILWWGLDGLKINHDGSLGWVKKAKEKKFKSNNELLEFLNGAVNLAPQSALQSMVSSCCVDTQCQNFSAQRTQDMFQCTQSQLQSLRLVQAQQTQNMAILGALYPYYYRPEYPYYFYGGLPYGQTYQNH